MSTHDSFNTPASLDTAFDRMIRRNVQWISLAGVAGEVTPTQYAAITKAADAKQLTVPGFLATFDGQPIHAARIALRQAITPFLPAGYAWPCTAATRG